MSLLHGERIKDSLPYRNSERGLSRGRVDKGFFPMRGTKKRSLLDGELRISFLYGSREKASPRG